MKRVETHIDATRDALEDLEIAFEVLKASVKRLREWHPEGVPVEEVEEEADIENPTNTTALRKF